MDLETVIQSEVGKRKANIVYERIYVEPRKMVQMNRFAGQKWRHRCREQTYGHQGRKVAVVGGDGGVMNWEIGIDMYTLMCIKLMPNKKLQYKQTNK